jgi:ABC-type transport system involved in multi-copper enzyme maturation permease subunit
MTAHPPVAATIAGRALRAEWTKLRSVRGTALAMLAMVGFTLLLSIVSASLGTSTLNNGVLTVDQFHFVHQPMTGDGTVTARVAAQLDSGAWAKAGIMLKARAAAGAPYAALMITPHHGVLMQADANTELTGPGAAPAWLRLTRTGHTVVGYVSGDGTSWRTVGTLTLPDLPADMQAGLFVASPPYVHILPVNTHQFTQRDPTLGQATFDHVTVTAATTSTEAWRDTDVTPQPAGGSRVDAGDGLASVPVLRGGSTRHSDGAVTVKGSGDIGRVGMGGIALADMDRVKGSLVGVQLGLIGAVALGTLSMTSEYKAGTIGTTFAARPGRGTVLAAKAAVLTVVAFLTGLAASVTAFFVARPMQRANGYGPPVYPEPSISDPAVIRAIVGSAAFLALIALFSMAMGTILRRTAATVVLLLTLLVVVPTIAAGVSSGADTWIRRVTPIAGLSIQQTMSFPPGSSEVATGVWTGFAVLCAYTVAALAAALWLLRRRDV